MKKTIHICFSITFLIVVLVLNMGIGLGNAGEYKAAGALPYKQGTEPVMVQVESQNGSIQINYSLPEAELITLDKEYPTSPGVKMKRVKLGNAPITAREGEPALPVIPSKVVIPAGRIIDKVNVIRGKKIALHGTHVIEYGEAPYPLMSGGIPREAVPNPEIYDSDNAFPGKPHDFVTIQKKRGVLIAVINLHPVTFHPESGRVSYYKNISLKITTKPDDPMKPKSKIRCRPYELNPVFLGVENPEELDTYLEEPVDAPISFGIVDAAESYRYVLITSETIRDATTDVTVHDLIAQKQSRGLSATIVTIEEIYSNYTGVDNAERLRNFIIDAYNNWETDYVLLGGDIDIIPMRKLWCQAYPGGDIDDLPSDLYFQCLDGSYDSDGDGRWGEPTDGADIPDGTGDVDLSAEVFIGRASAEDADEMSNFVYKTIAYENESEDAPYLRTALMCGEYLGDTYYAKPSKEEIRLGASTHGYTTAGFAACGLFTVHTLYDADGVWPASNIISKINSGTYSIINHLGHADYNYVMKFYNTNADALTNNNYIFAYSQGCIPGNFEVDCIAEHLTTSHRHGMFAVVFNSREGWGLKGSTDGASQRFDRQFWDAYFGEFILNLGAINADSHEDNLWDINGGCIRWCYYETNLFGDPETSLRGQIIESELIYISHRVDDSVGGDDDGIINPDEVISLSVTIKNAGTDAALGITGVLSTVDSYINVVDNSASFGDIPGGAEAEPLDFYTIVIASDCPTPHDAILTLDISDADGNIWSYDLIITVYTSSKISGYVIKASDGSPFEGAEIEYSGPLSGSVFTDENGYYRFGGIDGSYTLTAKADNYIPGTQYVTVPPDTEGVNFELTRELSVAPSKIEKMVEAGEMHDLSLVISNNSDDPIEFSIIFTDHTTPATVSAHELYDISHFVELPAGEEDPRIGLPVTLGSGGPDSYGYTWTDSDEIGGPQFVWEDISSTGMRLSAVSNANDAFEQQSISFSFPFYENEYSSIYVGSNGYITFGNGSTNYWNYPLPSNNAPANLIAGLYDDLITYSGNVYFLDNGTKVVIQYNNVKPYSGLGSYTFQIVLHKDGTITYYYKSLTGLLISCTVGIQNATRDDGLTVAYNTPYLKESLAVQFRLPPKWLQVTPASGTINPSDSSEILVTLDATELPERTFEGDLEIFHNALYSSTPITIPCRLTVGGFCFVVSPESYNFGNLQAGARKTKTITLINSCEDEILVDSITSSNTVFTHSAVLPLTIPQYEEASFEAAFNPVGSGYESGILTITSNAEYNPVITVALEGTGVRQISGYVRTAADSTAIEGAIIEYSGPTSGSVLTDPNGYYGFESVDGTYTLTAGAENYLPSTQDVTIPPDPDIVNFELVREISIIPTKIEETVSIGDSLDVNLLISNNSDAVMDYSIDTVEHSSPVSLPSGDQDSFGYVWTDSDDPDGPVFVWEDISSTGMLLSTISNANDAFERQSISFLFPFYGNEYSSIYVGSNGYITFGAGSTNYWNYPLPNINAPANLIAGFYDDLVTYFGNVYFMDDGTKVVIQYNNVKPYSGLGSYTFQIVLHKNGTIIYYYKSLIGLLTSCTVGIQNATRDAGLTVVYNAPYLKESFAVQFRLPSKWLKVTPASGTINPYESAQLLVTLDATQLSEGTFEGDLKISHNASYSTMPLIVPCILTTKQTLPFPTEVPDIEVSTLSNDFGEVIVDTRTLKVTVKNTGKGNLDISSITIENENVPGQFTKYTEIQTIPPDESATLLVNYEPNVVGVHTSELVLTSNDTDEEVVSISLRGTGIKPPKEAPKPSTSITPSWPQLYQFPQMLQFPKQPQLPQLYQFPQMLQLPKQPQLPQLYQLPQMPQMLQLPKQPQLPQWYQVPQVPQLPQWSK